VDYYSARLLVVILINDGKPKKKNRYDESIIVFKAKDYNHAFERALEIGRTQETTYKNSIGENGQDVRWALVAVTEIRCIGKKIDGVEVISKLHYATSENPVPSDYDFNPEEQKFHET